MSDFRDLMSKAAELVGLRPNSIQAIIDEETKILNQPVGITDRNTIPATGIIPLQNPNAWFRIPDVIACFVDMEGSTKLSATTHQKTTAKAYRYFTNTAVRIFNDFDAEYIDVRGDGVFALFNSDRPHTALAATVSFKTFVSRDFTRRIRDMTGQTVGGHYGIDRKTVLVRKLGLKIVDGNQHRQNEVWAGKPINMAAKLASCSTQNRIWVSDRFFKCLKGDRALNSCGCRDGKENQGSVPLWSDQDVKDDERFDFEKAYILKSDWCERHGKQYLKDIVAYDDLKEVRRAS